MQEELNLVEFVPTEEERDFHHLQIDQCSRYESGIKLHTLILMNKVERSSVPELLTSSDSCGKGHFPQL